MVKIVNEGVYNWIKVGVASPKLIANKSFLQAGALSGKGFSMTLSRIAGMYACGDMMSYFRPVLKIIN